MCKACDARRADPRWKAFREMGLLEVLTKVESAKHNAGDTAYVYCTAVDNGPAADVRAATMALTDDTIQIAQCRDVLVCLN